VNLTWTLEVHIKELIRKFTTDGHVARTGTAHVTNLSNYILLAENPTVNTKLICDCLQLPYNALCLPFNPARRRCSYSINYLHFDCTLAWVSSNVECLHGFFQLETMGNKWLEVDQPTCYKTYCLGVLLRHHRFSHSRAVCLRSHAAYLVCVSILEFDVNLISTEMHEGELNAVESVCE
jgi:hypothetical protein